jgi:phosphatidylserine/phosphatidylglycerophosphate/cardiolipin synthase-like enzyme
MHHKFVLFEKNVGGKSLVWTGSYNFTKSATRNNQENIVLLDSKPLIDKYAKQFSLLQERTRKLPVKYA